MANYYGQTRSNYFAVKNEEEFRAELEKFPVTILEEEREGKKLFGFIDNDQDGGGNAETYYDDEARQYVEIDWQDFFRKHLADDWVAIIVSSGAEKHRYINGFAVAYNNNGDSTSVGLEDIYNLAAGLGKFQTHASY